MYLGEEIPVLGNWFILHFTENRGMAFGMEFGGDTGKMALSIFRIVAVSVIAGYLFFLTKKRTPKGFLFSLSLIFAGALGNILDSAFYGVLFGNSSYHPNEIAAFLPEGGGYARFLFGNVVDMLYFPLVEGYFPNWLPIWGGDHFLFFRPVFNVADSSITIGVFLILINQRKYFRKETNNSLVETIEDEENSKSIDTNPVNKQGLSHLAGETKRPI